MLELKNITKIYGTGAGEVVALKNVNLTFRKNEFVSILGPSGCGKTTMLNLLGGLDRYTSGQLIINGVATQDFSDSDWDAYRNNSIGFVFQNYNLIPHLSVLGNVELALTLSGISNKKRKQRALDALKEVGIVDKAYKKPNQLSGGQMQRVAIARAIVNQPSIILADEPTGALDSETSKQVIDVLKSISKKRLVIMVTHNTELAKEYSSRIIKLLDGEVVEDTHPLSDKEKEKLQTYYKDQLNAKKPKDITSKKQIEQYIKKENKKLTRLNFKKTSMGFVTAIALSFKNLLTKKFRTLLVAFAGSIGIIGVMLVLAVSNGFNIYLQDFQKSTLMSLPISISLRSANIDFDSMRPGQQVADDDEILVVPKNQQSPLPYTNIHINNITTEYLNYLNEMNTTLFGEEEDKYATIVYQRAINKLIFNENKQNIATLDVKQDMLINNDEFLAKHLKLLAGSLPKASNEVVIVISHDNKINEEMLTSIGYEVEAGQKITAEWLVNQQAELKLFNYDDWYNFDEESQSFHSQYADIDNIYQNSSTIKIVGVVKMHPDDTIGFFREGSSIAYLADLDEDYYQQNKNSAVSTYLSENDFITIDGRTYQRTDELDILSLKNRFGATEIPLGIYIFAQDFESKDAIKSYMDNYNSQQENQEDYILYSDQAELITNAFSEMLNIVSIVLIAFAAISLIVSSIMIGIITYISVIERTKEIGVLRSLGARKKDIARVFLAESLIIGWIAGVIGALTSVLLTLPINKIVHSLVDILPKIAVVSCYHILFMVVLSSILTLIAGVIPARIASKKDPVVALRTE